MSDFREFISKVKNGTNNAVVKGREDAIRHVSKVSGMAPEKAEVIYNTVQGHVPLKVVVNASLEDTISFLCGSGLNQPCSDKTRQIESAMGCSGLDPVYGLLTDKDEGNRVLGNVSIILGDVSENVVLVNGDAGRVRNQSRKDFRENPGDVLYSWEKAKECRASAALQAMEAHELSSAPEAIVAEMFDHGKEYGPCQALVFGGLSPTDVSKIVVADQESLDSLRAAMYDIKRLVPAEVSKRSVRIRAPMWQHEEVDSPTRVSKPQALFFSVGDEVACKPTPTNPRTTGIVLDASGGRVAIEWKNGDRTVFDLAEALARLMPAPKLRPLVTGDVVYSLPGVDEKSAMMLDSMGYDPVSVYSLASTLVPPSKGIKWSEQEFSKSMQTLGVKGKFVDGFAKEEKGDLAFVPKRWFEASLPYGERLVIDTAPGAIKIVAGRAKDYMYLPEFTEVAVE
jgi:hypothetical protein